MNGSSLSFKIPMLMSNLATSTSVHIFFSFRAHQQCTIRYLAATQKWMVCTFICVQPFFHPSFPFVLTLLHLMHLYVTLRTRLGDSRRVEAWSLGVWGRPPSRNNRAVASVQHCVLLHRSSSPPHTTTSSVFFSSRCSTENRWWLLLCGSITGEQ